MLQLSLIVLLAFYVAWNLGANDVANSMGTSVGSKALTLKQALFIAGILEFTGAVFFGQKVSSTLATQVANPSQFADTPQLLMLGMVSVLLSCGIWLQIATSIGLPVASSHAVVGAIAGFSWVAIGLDAVDWISIGHISLAWLITPLISGLIAALFYSGVKYLILEQNDSLAQLKRWIPGLSIILVGIFGIIVLPSFFDNAFFKSWEIPNYILSLSTGTIAAVSITIGSWNQLEGLKDEDNTQISQKDNQEAIEKILGRFQVISACFVAFAHGSNDVGNAIAPLATITYIIRTGFVPLNSLNIPYWILIIGGLGIVAGLAIQGKKVITTIGEGIISLQPSSGFCAEIATATTILVASRFGLPVSTSHALVGSVVGIGLLKGGENVQFKTVKSVVLAWVITLPVAAIIGAISFTILNLLLQNFSL